MENSYLSWDYWIILLDISRLAQLPNFIPESILPKIFTFFSCHSNTQNLWFVILLIFLITDLAKSSKLNRINAIILGYLSVMWHHKMKISKTAVYFQKRNWTVGQVYWYLIEWLKNSGLNNYLHAFNMIWLQAITFPWMHDRKLVTNESKHMVVYLIQWDLVGVRTQERLSKMKQKHFSMWSAIKKSGGALC